MLIGCLFDAYYMMIWWWLCLFELFDQICKNMQSEWLTQFCICLAMLPQNTGGQACASSEGNLCDSLFCLIHHCKVPPVHFHVGGENHTNARMPSRHYNFCIWNSRIVRSACFAFDSFDGSLVTTASATCQLSKLVPTRNCNSFLTHCYGQIRSKLKSKRRNQWFWKLAS